jgi:nitroimidazol reductase NimA-like FMN-containing flavoprotein (pyridoxamine 5'-phosphate oxidase superfamily)
LSAFEIWGGRYLEREERESLLREARTARFCCLNGDGTIHATPVWYKYMDGKIVIATPSRSRKVRNVKRNKNVTILIDVGGPPRGVMIYGTAELDYNDVIPTAISLCQKYMEKEEAKAFAEETVGKGMDAIIKVKPKRMTSFHF